MFTQEGKPRMSVFTHIYMRQLYIIINTLSIVVGSYFGKSRTFYLRYQLQSSYNESFYVFAGNACYPNSQAYKRAIVLLRIALFRMICCLSEIFA